MITTIMAGEYIEVTSDDGEGKWTIGTYRALKNFNVLAQIQRCSMSADSEYVVTNLSSRWLISYLISQGLLSISVMDHRKWHFRNDDKVSFE